MGSHVVLKLVADVVERPQDRLIKRMFPYVSAVLLPVWETIESCYGYSTRYIVAAKGYVGVRVSPSKEGNVCVSLRSE